MRGAAHAYWRSVVQDAGTELVEFPRALLLDLYAALDRAEAAEWNAERAERRPRPERHGW